VVSDCGANLGYIITKKGFQRGAINASSLTNIQLINWAEFQDIFMKDYLKYFVYPELKKHVDTLVTYTEPLSPGSFLASGKLEKRNVSEFLALKEEYMAFCFFCLSHWQSGLLGVMDFKALELPIKQLEDKIESIGVLNEIKDVDNYEDFLSKSKVIASEGLRRFRGLIKKVDK